MTAPRVSLDDLIECSPDVVLALSPDSTVLYANPAVRRILGYKAGELTGSRLSYYLHPEDRERVEATLSPNAPDREEASTLELRVRHADGAWRSLQAIGVRLEDAPDTTAYYLRDFSKWKSLEKELSRRAFEDHLTGLANRSLFMDRLEHALNRTSRDVRQRASVSVLFLDLDNFKALNDSLGHEAGDDLLVTAGRRLSSCLRPGDTAARLGGDEFAVLLDDTADAGNAARLAARIMESLQKPMVHNEYTLYVTASLGIATTESGLDDSSKLLRAADIAMYRVKERGKGGYEVYEENMSAEVTRRLELENDLRCAADRGELVVHYQPEIGLQSGQLLGLEALLRWEYPKRGLLLPAEFMDFVEQSGLIVPIGLWVLRETCRQAARWQEQAPERLMYVSVNLSARQFQQPTLAEDLSAVLNETGLRPQSLVLEITESLILNETRHTVETLRRIRELGVSLALDDFSTGYSSLSYLEWIPVDFLKIDRSFIAKLDRSGGNTAVLISALAEITHKLGITMIAEGIETSGQLEELRKMNCNVGQGYYFSRPMPADETSEFLQASTDAG